MKTMAISILALLLAQAQENDLQRQAAVIKPRADELRWQKIPWVLDLAEGQRLAQAERRPIFLWAIADAPMERV